MNARPATRAHDDEDAAWIAALAFAQRKESWVAAAGDTFYKIFRRGNGDSPGGPARDWLDPACSENARREYLDMRALHGIDARVCEPLRLDHGCVVYPRLSGPDLHALLLERNAGRTRREAALRAAVALLASLHGATAAAARYPLKDYRAGGYLRPDAEVLRRLHASPRTFCIEGFEVRNFRYDQHRDAWLFFDPQGVSRGVAENGLARFIVSLLMVNWGKGGSPKIWTGFDARGLVATYESSATRAIDPVLLGYFLRETVAMRRHFAEKALRTLGGIARLFGRFYLIAYFHQLEKWTSKHEL